MANNQLWKHGLHMELELVELLDIVEVFITNFSFKFLVMYQVLSYYYVTNVLYFSTSQTPRVMKSALMKYS
jgi:hypothetical protein